MQRHNRRENVHSIGSSRHKIQNDRDQDNCSTYVKEFVESTACVDTCQTKKHAQPTDRISNAVYQLKTAVKITQIKINLPYGYSVVAVGWYPLEL